MRVAWRGIGAVAALLVVGACGDPDPPDSGSTPSPTSTATSTTATSSPTETSTSDSSDGTTPPTVAPAAGAKIRLPSFTGAFPQGWRVIDRTEGTHSAGDTDPLTGGFVFVSDVQNLGSDDFDKIVAIVLQHYEDDKVKPVRGENRVVDGVEGWVLEGARDGADFVYEWGTVYQGQDVHFTFEFINPPDDPMAMVDSVLASVQWR